MKKVANWRNYLQLIIILNLVFIVSLPFTIIAAQARNDVRTLYIYYTNTKESAKITFKRNGRYDKRGLAQLNQLLRDWRRDEVIEMDPLLFDLVWEVYQESGATGPIHVVSAYRSPATNEMLRSRSRAVAKGSRHTKGQALDFFIPGVRTSKLREIAMRKQVGGVGYYPASNSPFVHLDTGSVRAWPRMTRAQLQKLFPDGKTLHIPNTGIVLSQKGYQLAKADWQKCRRVPCDGGVFTRTVSRVASNKNPRTLFDLFFGGDKNEDENITNNRVTQRQVVVSSVNRPKTPQKAPIPHDRPAALLIANAPIPAPRLERKINNSNNLAIAAIDKNSIPKPRTLLTSDRQKNEDSLLTAYVKIGEQNNLGIIPNYENINSEPPIYTASISKGKNIENIINDTWDAVSKISIAQEKPSLTTNIAEQVDRLDNKQEISQKTKKDILLTSPKFEVRNISLVAPDLEHVALIFTDNRAILSERYAIILHPDEGDLNPNTELGQFTANFTFSRSFAQSNLNMFRFEKKKPLIIAQAEF